MPQTKETERVDLELKRYLDPGAKRDLMLLVKQIVAMANTEGGRILVGVTNDGRRVGVPDRDRSKWDPAPLGDQLDRCISPDHVEVVIAFRPDGCPEGTVVVEVTVPQYPDPPLVICRDGSDQSRTIFRKGDVLVRNNIKVEAASRSDYARWRREDRTVANLRRGLLVLRTVATIPGAETPNPPDFGELPPTRNGGSAGAIKLDGPASRSYSPCEGYSFPATGRPASRLSGLPPGSAFTTFPQPRPTRAPRRYTQGRGPHRYKPHHA